MQFQCVLAHDVPLTGVVKADVDSDLLCHAGPSTKRIPASLEFSALRFPHITAQDPLIMNRSLTALALALFATLAAGSQSASAQSFRFGISSHGITIGTGRHNTPSGYTSHHSSSYHSGSHHTPNVHLLDQQADQLAEVVKHLHDDAHQLMQNYEHSREIESFVSQLEDLTEHIHELLHGASNRGYLSASLEHHLGDDVRKARSLIRALDSNLHHQGFDGALTRDYHHMTHMRTVIASEATPLLRSLDMNLFGYCAYSTVRRDFHHGTHHDTHAPVTPVRRSGFRFHW